MPKADSIELIRRAQDGETAAWESLYLRYRDQLLFSIRCRLGHGLRARLESEDILHSVFRDVIGDLRQFEPRGAESLNHYLHVCVLNKIRSKADYYGAQKRQGEVPLSHSLVATIPSERDGRLAYVDDARYERLERALTRLPDDMREVVLLRRIEELSNKETAEVIGKTPEATSKIYNRALARLGTLMSEPSGS